MYIFQFDMFSVSWDKSLGRGKKVRSLETNNLNFTCCTKEVQSSIDFVAFLNDSETSMLGRDGGRNESGKGLTTQIDCVARRKLIFMVIVHKQTCEFHWKLWIIIRGMETAADATNFCSQHRGGTEIIPPGQLNAKPPCTRDAPEKKFSRPKSALPDGNSKLLPSRCVSL